MPAVIAAIPGFDHRLPYDSRTDWLQQWSAQ
jgi:hypothetical protein